MRNFGLILALVFLGLVLVFLVLGGPLWVVSHLPSSSTQQVEELKQKLKEEKVDKDYQSIVEYQRLRNSRIPIELAHLQARAIVDAAAIYDLPVTLIVGMTEAESLFDPMEISSAGAAGLMQILIEDGVDIDPDRKFDIRYNLGKGCEILRSKLEKVGGDLSKALINYSGGASGYTARVYEAAGRYTVYRERRSAVKLAKTEGGLE